VQQLEVLFAQASFSIELGHSIMHINLCTGHSPILSKETFNDERSPTYQGDRRFYLYLLEQQQHNSNRYTRQRKESIRDACCLCLNENEVKFVGL